MKKNSQKKILKNNKLFPKQNFPENNNFPQEKKTKKTLPTP